MRNTAVESCRCHGRDAATGGAAQRAAGERLQIAVGVVYDRSGERVLVARRRAESPHAGLWEFPGGKRRQGEGMEEALRRELLEEINVAVEGTVPLICIDYDYPDAAVRLHVWRITAWHGDACGREGQEIEWVPVAGLRSRDFPAANRAIIAELDLPPLYLITPDLEQYEEDFFTLAGALVGAGVRLIQFRSTRLPEAKRAGVIARLVGLGAPAGARLLVNGTPGEALRAGAHGVHLSSSRMLQTNERPLDDRHTIGASCHNRMELAHAARLGLDFAVLGPVRKTRTHPEARPLGWGQFSSLAASAGLPVYALGGVEPADMTLARNKKARGLAMIGGIWSAADPAVAAAACSAVGVSAW